MMDEFVERKRVFWLFVRVEEKKKLTVCLLLPFVKYARLTRTYFKLMVLRLYCELF